MTLRSCGFKSRLGYFYLANTHRTKRILRVSMGFGDSASKTLWVTGFALFSGGSRRAECGQTGRPFTFFSLDSLLRQVLGRACFSPAFSHFPAPKGHRKGHTFRAELSSFSCSLTATSVRERSLKYILTDDLFWRFLLSKWRNQREETNSAWW